MPKKSTPARSEARLSTARLRLAGWLNLLAGVLWLIAFVLAPISRYCWPEQGCPPATPGNVTCNVIIEPGCSTYMNYVPLAFGLFFLALALGSFYRLMRKEKK
jgi:hypothetical protein